MNLGTHDVGTGISAAGTTQATATLLINDINTLSTVASGAGVVLFPPVSQGAVQFQMVYNGGANPVKVYPFSGAQINGLGTNNAMLLAPATACEFYAVTTTQVIGVLSA